MVKKIEIERAFVLTAARDVHEGDLEMFLKKKSKKDLVMFCKKVQVRFLDIIKREHPGKSFQIGSDSALMEANLAKKIGTVLKG